MRDYSLASLPYLNSLLVSATGKLHPGAHDQDFLPTGHSGAQRAHGHVAGASAGAGAGGGARGARGAPSTLAVGTRAGVSALHRRQRYRVGPQRLGVKARVGELLGSLQQVLHFGGKNVAHPGANGCLAVRGARVCQQARSANGL